jgi:NADH-ubiquinone oxidoreductase chain 4
MLSLISLLLITIIFMGFILVISMNPILNNGLNINNNINMVTNLEEKNYVIPYVLRKYYSHIIDVRSDLIPSILTTSFWYENTELFKENSLKIQKEYMVGILNRIGVFLSLILYFLIILFWFKYRRSTIDYQVLSKTGSNNQFLSLDISLGLDGISLPFVLLIGFILPIVYLSNWSTIDSLDVYYILIIISLELFLITVFLVIDLIMFYIFFESILPPLFVLIGLYGASQKFRAGYYLFLYTLLGSLFMLLSFVKMGGDVASSFFDGYSNHSAFPLLQELVWIILFVSFSVKTPLVPVHIWLPLAHSDANVSGSIILASIVLKLALYGFLRILIGIFFLGTARLTPFFLGFCSMSLILSSFTTIRQFDLKVLVAYSSIAHMAASLLGTFSDTIYGLIGSVIFGLAHGFVSPGLFIIVGAVLYDRCGSRIINYYRGLSSLLPFFAFLFLILVFGNMGVPLTGNFIGEFLSLLGTYQQNIFIASIGGLSVILSAVYSIFMYNRVTSGSISPYIHTIPDLFRKEYYILIPLIILTLILGVYPYFICSDIEFGLSSYLLLNIWQASLNYDINQQGNKHENLYGKMHNPHNMAVIEQTVLVTKYIKNKVSKSKKNITPVTLGISANSSVNKDKVDDISKVSKNTDAEVIVSPTSIEKINQEEIKIHYTNSDKKIEPVLGVENHNITNISQDSPELGSMSGKSLDSNVPYSTLVVKYDPRNQPVDSLELTQKLNLLDFKMECAEKLRKLQEKIREEEILSGSNNPGSNSDYSESYKNESNSNIAVQLNDNKHIIHGIVNNNPNYLNSDLKYIDICSDTEHSSYINIFNESSYIDLYNKSSNLSCHNNLDNVIRELILNSDDNIVNNKQISINEEKALDIRGGKNCARFEEPDDEGALIINFGKPKANSEPVIPRPSKYYIPEPESERDGGYEGDIEDGDKPDDEIESEWEEQPGGNETVDTKPVPVKESSEDEIKDLVPVGEEQTVGGHIVNPNPTKQTPISNEYINIDPKPEERSSANVIINDTPNDISLNVNVNSILVDNCNNNIKENFVNKVKIDLESNLLIINKDIELKDVSDTDESELIQGYMQDIDYIDYIINNVNVISSDNICNLDTDYIDFDIEFFQTVSSLFNNNNYSLYLIILLFISYSLSIYRIFFIYFLIKQMLQQCPLFTLFNIKYYFLHVLNRTKIR